uniref:Uncharacterized protein n=1 Tax=Sphaerodactylus townsendi TaxID=933632 RepID=A0ACB8F371_9SAUR
MLALTTRKGGKDRHTHSVRRRKADRERQGKGRKRKKRNDGREKKGVERKEESFGGGAGGKHCPHPSLPLPPPQKSVWLLRQQFQAVDFGQGNPQESEDSPAQNLAPQ